MMITANKETCDNLLKEVINILMDVDCKDRSVWVRSLEINKCFEADAFPVHEIRIQLVGEWK